MNYSEIKTCDIANGPGVRTSIFVSGCRNKCPDCFNPETWGFKSGKLFTEDTINYIIETMEPNYVDGLSILGGEPLEPENQFTVLQLINKVKYVYPKKTIWLWTGFVWEDILNNPDCRANSFITHTIISDVDVVVDGPFEKDKKDLMLRFKGSSNQRLIDIHKSCATNEVVIWHDDAIFEKHEW